MWIFYIIICLSIIPFEQAFPGGSTVGNGGAFALCNDGRYYAFDYLIAKPNIFGAEKDIPSLEAGLNNIAFHLSRLKDPDANSFYLFAQNVFKQASKAPYAWRPWTRIPLLSSPVKELLPFHCRQTQQAIVHFSKIEAGPIEYIYDPILINRVSMQPYGILQISYMIVHEWFWEMRFKNEAPAKKALFNRLLHSKAIEQISPLQYQQTKQKIFRKN